ncbi:hypothetical protein L208DRAFT_1495524 [Tricholoma matsutake]|nr:hypothetical protein L208DRAFT_1495524 [Tricholoma matsutake 945]
MQHCLIQHSLMNFMIVIKTYNIPTENIYNMDEKGIQLGKDVYSVEDGNHGLITVIETVSTDGLCLQLSVIYQEKHRDLKWGRNNPCNVRYASHFVLPSHHL